MKIIIRDYVDNLIGMGYSQELIQKILRSSTRGYMRVLRLGMGKHPEIGQQLGLRHGEDLTKTVGSRSGLGWKRGGLSGMQTSKKIYQGQRKVKE